MASAVNREDRDDRVSVLTFDLEAERYCVRAESVASVLGVTDDQPVAVADDPWNAGTVSVGDDRVRVVDLPRAFNSSVRTTTRIDEPKLIVFTLTDDDGSYYGWLVDDVDVTRRVRPAELQSTATSARMAHVKGSIEIDDEEVVWLDERTIHG
ncbi:chemotaxis protein CheW [Haloterrigena alkaliphila]|uniref:Chemotaxis protein CheW n=1 Tax=Haloterrigena alkaliphila TaxID=2816475 RepID=A0A8A2VAJ0_9EURY|nr:chemotaxis protein CheW [Haloterrigena alkaliphila]QSW98106.1 chemotaxis protein CheW [Haloterrigena alkaliphila]